MPTPIHSKIINKIARGFFKEYGIVRKGQSRIWLDDHYWFTTIIEFQPFSNRQGTCLNVAVNFHWYEKDYLSFDIGDRESEFIDFETEEQFEIKMNSLVELALKRTLGFREKLANLETGTNTILNHKFASDSLWGNYHRAIICGLKNDQKNAEQYFDLILKTDHDVAWANKLKDRVSNLKTELNNITDFQKRVDLIIEKTRNEKKLKAIEIKNVW
ncbi:hypothetical protein [Psychroserpens ponticola]|uniref:DUF4304 domain-containing protein n=1 Tax=Psychroserpens ponticola TaxID=2932268 RepID=A0ABY7S3B1_9FLAO|nr:hypothetical protein [Psychroserpens ponticola]WCO03485.1 hypothetical protein MUN68_008245 [Psychroserpens ponticola]